MSLLEKYRPRRLADIIGQDHAIEPLQRFVADPHPACILLEGAGGTGKSATAQALANELGVKREPEVWASGLHVVSGNDLSVGWVNEFLLGPKSPLRFYPQGDKVGGRLWHVVIIEEFDWASQQAQRAMKVSLDVDSPKSPLSRHSVVVVATSNGAGKLDPALLQRFQPHVYPFGAGPSFKAACLRRLAEIWAAEAGPDVDLPYGFEDWGDVPSQDLFTGGQGYSFRVALRRLEQELRRVAAATV